MCEVEGQSPTELYKLHYNVSSPAQPSPAQPSPASQATLALLHIERVARERSGVVEHGMDTLPTWELTPGFL